MHGLLDLDADNWPETEICNMFDNQREKISL